MQARQESAIDAANALAMRRQIYAKQVVTRGDLEALLAAGRAAGAGASPEFAELLSSVATDLLVHQVDPAQYIQQADADWLIQQMRAGDGLSCRAEYEMLVDVIRYAVSVPPNLSAFAVAEIEKAIVQGHAVNGEIDHAAGVARKEDVEALRIAVFAATEGSSLHVTRDSAEALFRIAHATAGAANDESFDDFFAKAVGNYLMGIAFRWTPTVAAEKDLEHWLDEKPGFGGFLSSMLHSLSGGATSGPQPSRKGLFDFRSDMARAEDADFARENAADSAEMAQSARIDSTETKWILDHLTRDGKLTGGEVKLLMFLSHEAPEMPAELKQLLDRQAA